MVADLMMEKKGMKKKWVEGVQAVLLAGALLMK